MPLFLTLCKGFAASASLIVAIGAQNAFVMRQGLLRQHLFLTALLCSIIDASLILTGILGMGCFVDSYPVCFILTKYLAIVFLVSYGAYSLFSALRPRPLQNTSLNASVAKGATHTILLLLTFSLLNPHVYLDTVLLLGSIAAQHPANEKPLFAIGAIAASFCWFFSLTYGVRLLNPLLNKKYSWPIIDTAIALTMWIIAFSLFQNL